MKQISLFFFFYYILMSSIRAQSIIDIVDPYEMKVARSASADTFYITPSNKQVISNLKQDTLRTYDVFLEERPTPFGIAYICNGNEVTKQKYLEYKKFWNAMDACTPCLLYTYDDKSQLKYTAYQYKNCMCGEYKEYYPEKVLKVEGQFKQNTIGNWDVFKKNNFCNIRNGVWTYYYEDGTVEKTEVYVDGKLKESKLLNNSTNPSSSNQETEDKPTKSKFNIFKRK